MLDFALLRKTMVESQVRTNEVTDRRVLRAMLDLPRERFVPAGLDGLAYSGDSLPFGTLAPGRSLPAPVVTARLIQLAGIEAGEQVLEIGCATGYATALLASLAGSVTGLECDAALAALARSTLSDLGIANATVCTGSLAAGAADAAPFDAIVVSGMLPEVPAAWHGQLREGGRLVAILAEGPIGRATVFARQGSGFSRRQAFDASAPLLPGFERKPAFSL